MMCNPHNKESIGSGYPQLLKYFERCPSLSISSIEGALRKLVEAGELRREGSGKSIHYYQLK